jgi:hypothetical protein
LIQPKPPIQTRNGHQDRLDESSRSCTWRLDLAPLLARAAGPLQLVKCTLGPLKQVSKTTEDCWKLASLSASHSCPPPFRPLMGLASSGLPWPGSSTPRHPSISLYWALFLNTPLHLLSRHLTSHISSSLFYARLFTRGCSNHSPLIFNIAHRSSTNFDAIIIRIVSSQYALSTVALDIRRNSLSQVCDCVRRAGSRP